jgi:hypothetical protein
MIDAFQDLNKMGEIWIIGLGQFGYIAFQRLSKILENSHFVLVDPLEENLRKGKSPISSLRVFDGVEFLIRYLEKARKPDWIIPALPVHLAAEWLLLHLGPERLRRISLPAEIETLAPNPIWGPEGNLYVSHADFKCPDDCDEPQDICAITGNVRKQNMFEILGNLEVGRFRALNIQSHQLAPGVGGYRPEQLFELMEKVWQARGAVMVSTACRCHGALTGLERL